MNKGERGFIISGKMMAEMLLRLGVYDEKVLSEYVKVTDRMKFKLWVLHNSWMIIFPERFQRWLYKRHLAKLDTESKEAISDVTNS